MPDPIPSLARHFSRARRWVAHRLWNVATRIWVEPTYDDRTRWAFWDMNCTFRGTEADAYRIFDAMVDVGYTALDLHEIDTRFAVGGMRRDDFADDEEVVSDAS
jgi:hypothetical protein